MLISKEAAQKIALAYREIEVAERLLAEISEEMERRRDIDIRDAFGRQQHCLQLGVPSSHNSTRLFDVPWKIARPIIELHIAEQRALIEVLSAQAAEAASAEGGKPDRASGVVARPAGAAGAEGAEQPCEAK